MNITPHAQIPEDLRHKNIKYVGNAFLQVKDVTLIDGRLTYRLRGRRVEVHHTANYIHGNRAPLFGE